MSETSEVWTPANWLAHANNFATQSLGQLEYLIDRLYPKSASEVDYLARWGSLPDDVGEQEAKGICSLGHDYMELVEALEHVSPLCSKAANQPVKVFGCVEPHAHALAARIVKSALQRVWETVAPGCTAYAFDPKACAERLYADLCGASRKKVGYAIRRGLNRKGFEWLQAAIDREYEVALDREDVEKPPGFVPTQLQREILEALTGRALTADELCVEVSCSRSTLYGGKSKTGGLNELMALRLVANDRRIVGYYRPDFPPGQESN